MDPAIQPKVAVGIVKIFQIIKTQIVSLVTFHAWSLKYRPGPLFAPLLLELPSNSASGFLFQHRSDYKFIQCWFPVLKIKPQQEAGSEYVGTEWLICYGVFVIFPGSLWSNDAQRTPKSGYFTHLLDVCRYFAWHIVYMCPVLFWTVDQVVLAECN